MRAGDPSLYHIGCPMLALPGYPGGGLIGGGW
jgi:hypothetical protein